GESLGNMKARKRRAVFEFSITVSSGLQLCSRVLVTSVMFIRRHGISIKSPTVPPHQLFPSTFMVGISVRNVGIPMIRIPLQCRSLYRGTTLLICYHRERTGRLKKLSEFGLNPMVPTSTRLAS